MPRRLERMLRPQRVLDPAIRTDEDHASLAWPAGLADRAHLARETRALVGATPGALVAARRPAASGTSTTATGGVGTMTA